MYTALAKKNQAPQRAKAPVTARAHPSIRNILRGPTVQPKLKIGAANDPAEREADAVADRVMRMGSPVADQGSAAPSPRLDSGPNPIRRMCEGCEDELQRMTTGEGGEVEDEELVQPKEKPGATPALSTASEGAIRGLGGGAPLARSERSFFEPRFGHDFSDVRIHTDAAADQSARSISARAYTFGSDIAFAGGEYTPGTPSGRRLLAHELAHTVQQGNRIILDEIQRVELTYDDGPDSAGNTRAVLNALDAAGARATFYLVGKRVVLGDNWRVVFDIAASGHWLGNHAFDWDYANDDHDFLKGHPEQRAQEILQTEWAIRDALIRGRDEARNTNNWESISATNRTYIDDIIAHGTGRFRTPGFRSKVWEDDGRKTLIAISLASRVLVASGLRPLKITEVSKLKSLFVDHEGVTVNPDDWRRDKTQSDIETAVAEQLDSNEDSILLHSRVESTAAATPAIVADIKSRKFTFDPTVRGALGSGLPKPGFAGLSTISDPPTPAELAKARAFLKKHMLSLGPVISGHIALGIFALAQRAGKSEVTSFIAQIKGTTIETKMGPVPMAGWLHANDEWRLFSGFFPNWWTNKPFPRKTGSKQ